MKLFFALSALTLLFGISASAQSNFKPGYIINPQNDTVKGFVNYHDWTQNPSSITFKKNLTDSKSDTYTKDNAIAFGVDGFERYIKFSGSISQDSNDPGLLSIGNIDTTTANGTVFLRAVYTGKKVSLYEYSDIVKTRYFIASANNAPTELAYHLYLSTTAKLLKVRQYVSQLQDLIKTYQPQNQKLYDEAAGAEYTAPELKKVVVEINGNASVGKEQATMVNSEDRSATRFFIELGANAARSYYTGMPGTSTANASNTSVLPAINLGFDLVFNKNVGTFLIKTALTVTGSQTNLSYSTGSTGLDYTSVTSFKQYTIGLNPQLVYNIYNTPATKIYIAAGVAVNVATYQNKQYYTVSNLNQTKTDLLAQPGNSFQPQAVYINESARLGLVLNKLEIFVGYITPVGINKLLNDSAIDMSAFQGGIGYSFGK